MKKIILFLCWGYLLNLNVAASSLATTLDQQAEHHMRRNEWKLAAEFAERAFLLEPNDARKKLAEQLKINTATPPPNPLPQGVGENGPPSLPPHDRQTSEGRGGTRILWAAAENIFEEARHLNAKGQSLPAYQKYKESFTKLSFPSPLVGEGGVGGTPLPSFYPTLIEEKKILEEKLLSELHPKVEAIKKEFEKANFDWKKIGVFLEELQKNYPTSEALNILLTKIYNHFDLIAAPWLIRAKTMLELDGCAAAKEFLLRTKKEGIFESVPSYQEADKVLESCHPREGGDPA